MEGKTILAVSDSFPSRCSQIFATYPVHSISIGLNQQSPSDSNGNNWNLLNSVDFQFLLESVGGSNPLAPTIIFKVYVVAKGEKRILLTMDHSFGKVLAYRHEKAAGVAIINPQDGRRWLCCAP